MIDVSSEPILTLKSTSEARVGKQRKALEDSVRSQAAVKRFNVENVENPTPTLLTKDRFKNLEQSAMHESLLPAELKQFISTAYTYFQELAISEGLISKDTSLQFRTVFVEESNWKSYGDGEYDPLTNTVYLKYFGDTPQQQLTVALNLMHELRHRVSKRHYSLHYHGVENNIHQFSKSTIRIPLELFALPDSSLLLIEELYVVDFVSRHATALLERSNVSMLTEAWKERSTFLQNNTQLAEKVDETLVSSNKQGKLMPDAWYSYWPILKTSQLLTYVMPNFSELCVAIRRGDKNARSELARAITSSIGKKALAALIYTDRDSLEELMTVMKVCIEEKENISTNDLQKDQQRSIQRENALFIILKKRGVEKKTMRALLDINLLSLGQKVYLYPEQLMSSVRTRVGKTLYRSQVENSFKS